MCTGRTFQELSHFCEYACVCLLIQPRLCDHYSRSDCCLGHTCSVVPKKATVTHSFDDPTKKSAQKTVQRRHTVAETKSGTLREVSARQSSSLSLDAKEKGPSTTGQTCNDDDDNLS